MGVRAALLSFYPIASLRLARNANLMSSQPHFCRTHLCFNSLRAGNKYKFITTKLDLSRGNLPRETTGMDRNSTLICLPQQRLSRALDRDELKL